MKPSEAQEQAALIQWCQAYQDKRARFIFAIPNGMHSNPIHVSRQKAQGLRSGVPDLFLPVPSNGRHGLFIEMKVRKGGKVSKAQERWIERLNGLGYMAAVCRGLDEAIETIAQYMEA